jgi:periplasmic divalent cation tolerance protein
MVLILTTLPSLKAGRQFARMLLAEKLAACVSLTGAVESHYVWKKKRERMKEYFCWIKTRKSLTKKVTRFIKKHHPYEVPEILCLPVSEVSRDYLKWVRSVT